MAEYGQHHPVSDWQPPPPPPRSQLAAAGPDVHAAAAAEQPWQAELRRAAVERMDRASVNHATNVWEHRFRYPIAPHCLVLLYSQPAETGGHHQVPSAGQHTVTAAWRLWPDDPEVADLPTLLFRLHHHLASQVVRPGFDLRAELPITAADVTQSTRATYIGIAVTTLDTPQMSWADARLVTSRAVDLGSYIYIVLDDGTVINIDRRGFTEFNARRIRSTLNLGYPNGDSPYPWTRVTLQQLQPDPDDDRNPLKWLIALGDTCAQAEAWRVVTGTDRRRR